MADITQVFLLALLTTVAMGLGALPFLFVGDLTPGWLGASNALASGLMLSASFGLVYEGAYYGLRRTMLGVVLGSPLSCSRGSPSSHGRGSRWAPRR